MSIERKDVNKFAGDSETIFLLLVEEIEYIDPFMML